MDDDTRALYLATIAEMNRQITAHLDAVDAIRRNRRAVRDEMLRRELAGIKMRSVGGEVIHGSCAPPKLPE